MTRVYWTPDCGDLAREVVRANLSSPDAARWTIETFVDGEKRYLFDPNNVKDQETILVGSTHSPEALVDLLIMASELHYLQARETKIVIPYFGWSTSEREVRAREPQFVGMVEAPAGEYIAHAIARIPGNKSIHVYDIHADAIVSALRGNGTIARHHYCEAVILEMIRGINKKNIVLGTADKSRINWVSNYAEKLVLNDAISLKVRTGQDHTKAHGMFGDVKDCCVIMCDDMVRTGGSAITAAQQFIDHGALEVYLVCTHGVLPEGAIEKLKASGVIKGVLCTDSHPHARLRAEQFPDFVKVYSVAGIIAESLR